MSKINKALFSTFIYSVATISLASTQQQTQTTMPLNFVVGNPPPYLELNTIVNIQNKSIPLIFDTGAKKISLLLNRKLLKNMKFKYTHKKLCFMAVDGKHCEQEFSIPEVYLGSFVVKDVHGVEMPANWSGQIGPKSPYKATEAASNGYIGYPLLSQFNLLLDPVHSRVIAVKRGNNLAQYNMKKWIAIPFTDHLNTKLKLNGKPMVFSWDTGAMPSAINPSAVKNLKKTTCLRSKYYTKKNCTRIRTESLTTIDNKSLSNLWFNLFSQDLPPQANFDGLIGSNFYSKNLIYFDFDHHLIYVKPILRKNYSFIQPDNTKMKKNRPIQF